MKYTFEEYKKSAMIIYGELGGEVYDIMESICKNAFDNLILPNRQFYMADLMSGYNKSTGFYHINNQSISATFHHTKINSQGMYTKNQRELFDFITHELCHAYQHEVLGYSGTNKRGVHTDKTWFESIKKASPYVCNVDINHINNFGPKSTRIDGKIKKIVPDGWLTESEVSHFPNSFVRIASDENDNRLSFICK
ncbi:hypothetical protein FGD67_20160 [Colwellia sp. M166]|uniref:hypothetical protein n=1 Tax=Colwellia sp. M166 TaxID=2583805 RepID=UPI00211E692E|nr:hypothetical protein [Colwellia sp. M166]UUO25262.1 hypothetical protein FGD67_20160 [Colwellia sp. M166]|tara:strand:- start:444 stop:1028 length:585 start_codon:yes stop_codon:yes gene_type:complete